MEIERMKQDIRATREKSGVYINSTWEAEKKRNLETNNISLDDQKENYKVALSALKEKESHLQTTNFRCKQFLLAISLVR